MADDIDRAADLNELYLDIALNNKPSNDPGITLTGECHNCNHSVSQDQRFCDVDCRDDWEKRKAAR
jgi:hypothetical protein